ncbi:Histidine protein kinase NIK1 like [Verticillium longisporum]|uniref:Histidine protein kinase NIK1 like n=1 Tax=Verticillium longisporum TaxID=100787 RepID=A0A8I3AR97_VERLO|nr:Histidine protein kinase NIK1 like [Verticillium longisporum]
MGGAREYDSLLISKTVVNELERPIPRDALTSCSDTNLTALAQLCALRLNASRALVSLFDSRRQYIVAEATPTIPLHANATRIQDHLWLCGTAVPRAFGICDHVLVDADAHEAIPTETVQGTLPVLVVPDLAADPRFNTRSFVKQAPNHRFYAGVPIRSPKGFNIGVLSVFDPEPRQSLPPDQVQFLADLAQTIMGHLESRRRTESYIRSERMVQGLGHFIQGRDQPATWWSTTDHHVAEAQPYEPDDLPVPDVPYIDVGEDGLLEATDQCPELIRRPSLSTASIDCQAGSCAGSADTFGTMSTNASSVPPVDPHPAEIDRIFAKAAHIIRESLDVDGALFLDASVGSFGGMFSPAPHKSSTGSDDPTSSSEDSGSGKSGISDEETPCHVFGRSTSHNHPVPNIFNQAEAEANTLPTLTDKFLKKLMRRYPNGEIFSFDQAGSWYSGESSVEDSDPSSQEPDAKENASQPKLPRSAAKVKGSPYSRRNEAMTIGSLFPGARSVAMVPLWDPYKERWHAGGFVWSKNSARMITTIADLPYLRAFGMITMAEIRRLDAAVADKAKADILGSLSHELRSPLHGIVAATELLHGTQLDAFQVDVVHTIEISGKTLLDIIDHLLAHSKINTFLRASKARRRNKKGRRGLLHEDQEPTNIEAGMMTLVSDVQVDLLAEEVIESVFIGHSFQHMVAAQLTRHGAQGPMSPAQERLDTIYSTDMSKSRINPDNLPTHIGNVQVIVDIDPNPAWTFSTQPGAIRRIIMNLFGNALKYTSHGHVKISLKQEEAGVKNSPTSSQAVVVVADTGKGITEEFLRTKLFTPFSQENHLAPGTGLGLSLVRHIVASLGGSITVKSRVGRGTTVTVSLPLTFSQRQERLKEPDARFSFDSQILQSIRVATTGFTDKTLGPIRVHGSSAVPIDSLPLNWYNMQLCKSSGNDGTVAPDADVVIYSEAAFSQLDARSIKEHPLPGIVVCHNAGNSIKFDAVLKQTAAGAVFEFIHQPITPRKFGKAVATALTRWKQLKVVNTVAAASVSNVKKSNSGANSLHCSGTKELSSIENLGQANVSGIGSRLWNMDIDPDFELALPQRRTPAPASAEANSIKELEAASAIKAPSLAEAVTEADGANEQAEGNEIIETNSRSSDSTATISPQACDRPQFLIVDDNIINLKILCIFMKRLGREHCTSMNGQQALDAFSANPEKFCCILMDINMPVMDGLESTRRIRQFERLHKLDPTTIIAITGLGSQDARKEGFASGLDLFLTKPVRMRELRTILKERGLGETEEGQSPEPEAAAVTT